MGRLTLSYIWAYRTSERTSTQATPLSVVYRAKAMLPIKGIVHSARLALTSKLQILIIASMM